MSGRGTGGDIDFARINAQALSCLETLLVRWLPDGRMEAGEWVSINPTRNDTKAGSFRINVTTGKWADFATGDGGGDPISLYVYLNRILGANPQLEGAKRLAVDLGAVSLETPPGQNNKRRVKEEWRRLMPVPDGAGPMPDQCPKRVGDEWQYHDIAARFAYRDASGALLGYACRIELPDGSKDVMPLTYCVNDKGKRQWKWKHFPTPRPLYGLDRLAAQPQADVLLVEGEGKADAWPDLPGLVVMGWPGGSNAVHLVDVEPLRGRNVFGWPDADHPGFAAMCGKYDKRNTLHKGFAQLLEHVAASFDLIGPPAGVAEGWDLKDAKKEGWDAARVMAHIAANKRAAKPLPFHDERQPAQLAPPPREAGKRDDVPPANSGRDYGGMDDTPADSEGLELEGAPFRLLGYDHGQYFYIPNGSKQVMALTPTAHSKYNLLALAPLQWWERKFPGRNTASWDAAANALIQVSHTHGPFDPGRIRGRGAWWDDGAAVLHLGDRVISGGSTFHVEQVQSRFIYEATAPLRADLDNPLNNMEANALVDLCSMLNWEKPINAKLLAGWCMIAPICGALEWRPHIWVTGGSGTGKTWIMEKIVDRCCGDAGLFVQAETTEAGLRQTLGHDAMPVIFDEAESESQRSRARIENVMGIMRQASSESGGRIIKGGANGVSQSYQIRSCFAFSSIAVGAQQFADKSRVSVLGLKKNVDKDAREKFESIKHKWHQVFTGDFPQRLHARAYKLIDVIRRNADTFAIAGAEKLGGQRMGDQVGALLAGAYALTSSKIISLEDARAWVQKQDWTEEEGLTAQRDEDMCLSFLMEHSVKVQGLHATMDRTLGELVSIASMVLNMEEAVEEPVTIEMARAALGRNGFRVNPERTRLYVSNTHSAIARMLRDTPWVSSWGRILRRLDRAEAIEHAVRFAAGSRSRAVAIPLNLINDEVKQHGD